MNKLLDWKKSLFLNLTQSIILKYVSQSTKSLINKVIFRTRPIPPVCPKSFADLEPNSGLASQHFIQNYNKLLDKMALQAE